MKWVKQDIYGNEQIWYSSDVIDQIKEMILKNIPADTCSRCDGCGYYDGCGDKHCAVYQANEIIKLIESEDL